MDSSVAQRASHASQNAPQRASRSSQDLEIFQGTDGLISDENTSHRSNDALSKPLPDLPSLQVRWKRRKTALHVAVLVIVTLALMAGLGGYFGHRAAEHKKRYFF